MNPAMVTAPLAMVVGVLLFRALLGVSRRVGGGGGV